MSLDSALRQGLIGAGDRIEVEATAGIDAVARRVSSQRKRRVAVGATLTAIVVATAGLMMREDGRSIDAAPDFPPAHGSDLHRKERNPSVPEKKGRSGVTVPLGGEKRTRARSAPDLPIATGTASARRPSTRVPERRRSLAAPMVPRLVTDDYRIERPAGAHMGENAGLGCTQGPGATGADDCFQFEVGEDEKSFAIEFHDDADVIVSFTINEHLGGNSRALGSFCGTTDGPITVRPAALLLVSISGGNECSDRAPTSGRLTARFWESQDR